LPAEPFGVRLVPIKVRGCALQSLSLESTGVLRADDEDDVLGKIPARSRPRFHEVSKCHFRKSVSLQSSRAIWTKFSQMIGVKERVTLAGAL